MSFPPLMVLRTRRTGSSTGSVSSVIKGTVLFYLILTNFQPRCQHLIKEWGDWGLEARSQLIKSRTIAKGKKVGGRRVGQLWEEGNNWQRGSRMREGKNGGSEEEGRKRKGRRGKWDQRYVWGGVSGRGQSMYNRGGRRGEQRENMECDFCDQFPAPVPLMPVCISYSWVLGDFSVS